MAVPARRTSDVWTRYVPFDSLPQVLNPKGGYIHNENDPPYYTNMRQPLDRAKYPAYFPAPALRLRSQMAIDADRNEKKLSLEDVIALKHSYRMLLADRVRDDLVAAVRASSPTRPTSSAAIDMIAAWDKTVGARRAAAACCSRAGGGDTRRAPIPTPCSRSRGSPAQPASTPRGPQGSGTRRAAHSRRRSQETAKRYGASTSHGAMSIACGMGNVDVPVGGCAGDLGCFRVLNFATSPDGKRSAIGGDGWILAVEFGDEPRAYSVLAYGESPKEDSPYFSDQAEMFAKGEMKRVSFTPADVDTATVKRYNPGAQP